LRPDCEIGLGYGMARIAEMNIVTIGTEVGFQRYIAWGGSAWRK
jgi:hypothetical protein